MCNCIKVVTVIRFRSGELTPSEVAERVIERIKELKMMKPDMNMVTQFDEEDIREVFTVQVAPDV